ncbi:MAG: hypothetical protein JO117_10250, partial [Verrucomicrobia bacterium]|nr:hypothetical protein [Verrucomicrobiota bacterium]
VGEAIVLNELSREETNHVVRPLAGFLNVPVGALSEAVFEQTGGSVYLTQLLSERLWERATAEDARPHLAATFKEEIQKLAAEIVTRAPDDIHFQNIKASLHAHQAASRVYCRLLFGKEVSSAERELLWFTGIAPREGPTIYRNRIYEQVFRHRGPIDQEATWRRQRLAVRMAAATLVVISITALFLVGPWTQNQRDIRLLANAGFAWNGPNREIIVGQEGKSIRTLDNLSAALHRLQPKSLNLSGCQALQNVDSLKGSSALENLFLFDCPALQNVDGLKGLSALKSLSLTGCRALQNVDDLKELSALQRLDLNHCQALRNVDLSGCRALQNVDDLKELSALQSLDLSGCEALPKEDLASLVAALKRTRITLPDGQTRGP